VGVALLLGGVLADMYPAIDAQRKIIPMCSINAALAEPNMSIWVCTLYSRPWNLQTTTRSGGRTRSLKTCRRHSPNYGSFPFPPLASAKTAGRRSSDMNMWFLVGLWERKQKPVSSYAEKIVIEYAIIVIEPAISEAWNALSSSLFYLLFP
jgi:hypothetical protein